SARECGAARFAAIGLELVRVVHRRLPGADRSAPPVAHLARRAGLARAGAAAQARGVALRSVGAGAHLGIPVVRQARSRVRTPAAARGMDAPARAAADAARELSRAVEETCRPAMRSWRRCARPR